MKQTTLRLRSSFLTDDPAQRRRAVTEKIGRIARAGLRKQTEAAMQTAGRCGHAEGRDLLPAVH